LANREQPSNKALNADVE
jgi:hypothetical protein